MVKKINFANDYFTPQELSKRWGVSVGTLANKRSINEGPEYIKFFQKVYYKKTVILKYEKDNF